MKIAIILNGISLRKEILYHKMLPALRREFNVEVFETLTQNDATPLTIKAIDKHFDVVIAAGGDGTVHQVVNGLFADADARSMPVLGVIPMGSGNDFARCLGIQAEPARLVAALKNFQPRKIDAGKITYHAAHGIEETRVRYFVNEADIGMGPEVVRRVMASGRPFGSAVSYYLAILSTFATYRPLEVKAATPGWTWQGKIRTLAVANGNYFGNGLCISPDARPDDGKFGTFTCGAVSVFDFLRYSSDLKKGRHVRIPGITYNEASTIELSSPDPCAIEADGEILGYLPARIELLPKIISVL